MPRARWDFVLCVLDALKEGCELEINKQQIFRLDIGRAEGQSLAHECAEAAELLRKHRIGVYASADAREITSAMGAQTERLVRAIADLNETLAKRKGKRR